MCVLAYRKVHELNEGSNVLFGKINDRLITKYTELSQTKADISDGLKPEQQLKF